MAINKVMRAALKALSYPDLDLKKHYKVQRSLQNWTSRQIIKPPDFRMWDHQIISDGRAVPVRIFAPPGAPQSKPAPVLVFFHGGGWVVGTIDSYTKVCANLAKATGCTVVSVDYRLAPEYKFPTALEDCYAVTREICTHDAVLGFPASHVLLIGDSAGGNLAAAVCLMARDRGEFLPAGQILLYPATNNDHTPDSPYRSIVENGSDYLLTSKRVCDYVSLYIGNPEDSKNPYFAPLLAEDFSNQPKTLLIAAEYCPLRDEGMAYAIKLKKAGNWVKAYCMPDALHGYFSLSPRYPQVRKTYRLINRFLSEVMQR